MFHKQQLFIHNRKEIVVLTLIASMVTLFAFTLGVHLGKRIAVSSEGYVSTEVTAVKTISDQIPKSHEFIEQNKFAWQTLEETLSQELHDEISRNGIKIDAPKAVDLPEKLKSQHPPSSQKPLALPEELKSRGNQSENEGSLTAQYTLQIGSFPSLEEAKTQISHLGALESKSMLREVQLSGKGKWYRVYLGTFPSASTAEEAGQKYKAENKIKGFIVSNLSD